MVGTRLRPQPAGTPAAAVIAATAAAAIAAVLAGPLATPAQAAETTLYVGGAACDDLGPGTRALPLCTIVRAATIATAGQTVLVAAGTYTGRVSVARSGLPGSPIVFRADEGAEVIVTGGSNGFAVSSRHDVTIEGFRVTGTSSHGIYVASSSAIVLSGNTVTDCGLPVKGYTATGIYLSGTMNSTVTGNTTDHNSNHGIYLTGGSSGNLLRGNEASWNANGYQRNANGIDVISPGNTIVGNVLHDNEDSGLNFYTGANNNLAALNVSYHNGDHGIDNLNVTGGRIIGNTVYGNCTTGINVEGTSGDFLVANNIAVDNAVYPAYHDIACNRRKGNIGVWDSAPPTTTVEANLVWLTTPGTMYAFGTTFTSLAAMRAVTGQEVTGIQADPLFADPAGRDLRIAAGSPAIDSAWSDAPDEQSVDITGTPRTDDPATPDTGTGSRGYDDRGAYEFLPGAPPTAAAVNP